MKALVEKILCPDDGTQPTATTRALVERLIDAHVTELRAARSRPRG